MKYKCIIFDFDGTLADSENSSIAVYNILAEKYGYKKLKEKDIPKLKLTPIPKVLSQMGIPYTKVFTLLREGQKLLKDYMHTIKPYKENLKQLLDDVYEHCNIMGVISSNSKKNIKAFFRKHDITCFCFIISSPLFTKEVKINKIKRKYNLENEDILYVGDEVRDIISSHKADVDICSVSWGFNSFSSLEEEKPTYIIHDLDELLDIIQ